MALHFLFLCSTILCLFGACAASKQSIFSANSTIVPLGSPFIAKCQLTVFEQSSSAYTGGFFRNGSWIIRFNFPSASSSGSLRQPTFTVNEHAYTDLEITVLRYNTSTYEIEIIPKTVTPYYYQCNIDHTNFFGDVSEYYYNILVVKTAPTATVSLSTPKPTIGQAFTASCAIANFNLTTTSNFTVAFQNKQEGLLAVYRIDAVQSQVLIKKHANLILHFGERTAYPAFDLLITERTDVISNEYWCSLSEGNWTVQSTHWSDGPLLEFTSFKLNETATLATCSIANFEPAGRNYSVTFVTSLGAHENNEIAAYTVRPGKILEFDTEPVTGWTDIVSPEKVTFPVFPVIASGNGLKGHWMSCFLSLGEEGNAHYPEYKSERVLLD